MPDAVVLAPSSPAGDLGRPAVTPPDHRAAVDLDRLGDEIAALSAHLAAATARLLSLLREFDARGGWAKPSG
jgi:hypothetical protein